ncbi:MAG: AAA family ATPase [SAR202 cluster bacterium]|nr:AAA family ATPase [SAR202 cluster bacterium]
MTQARDALTQGLNPSQREAVLHVDGPLLIVAGPGSGKTRVITHRIAYLVREVGISSHRIAAVTFTNRAAKEMKERLERLLGNRAHQLTAGTFHALCTQILRRDGEAIGIPSEFVILDDEDQMSLVKRAMENAEIDPKRFPPRNILSAISAAKSQLIGPDGYPRGSYYDDIVQRVYARYQELMTRSHAVDFDDLLAKVVELFRRAPEVRAKYQERYMHLLVDEFQDTNVVQYQLAKEIAGKYQNLCVVGDPDQSIYSWRNADIRNILSFQKDFPTAKVVRLGQNYRSTKTILEAAQHLISGNRKRLEQRLYTDNDKGEPVLVAEQFTDEEEAQFVLQEVERLTKSGRYTLRDIVVTFRVNAQSRALEEACLRYGVPYRLIGGVKFYQRKEVKDILAYLRLIQDPYDEVSLVRVINVPSRGIGDKTIQLLQQWANGLGMPMYTGMQLLADPEASKEPPASTAPFNPRQRQQLADFLKLIAGLREDMGQLGLPRLLDDVMERTGYRRSLLDSGDDDVEDRLDNLRELRGVAADLADRPAPEALQAFLENAALISEQDALQEGDVQQYLTLITLHQIKGLEFPAVFMVGMEEGVLPHMRSLDDPDQLEEERRLAYVGFTRARERLYLLRAFRRRMFGQGQGGIPSRFLAEVPQHLIETPGRQPQRQPAVAYDRWSTPASAAPAQRTSTTVNGAPFKAGEKVTHASFGDGIVVSCNPSNTDYEVTVAFKGSAGIKRLLASFAKLDKVG